MIDLGEYGVIRHLREKGYTISAIGRELGIDRKTVRKYLRRAETPCYGPRNEGESKVGPWRSYVKARLEAYPALTAIRLFREIRDLGYPGGYTIVKQYVRQVRPEARPLVEIRFETPPGRQAQADFGVFESFFEEEGRTERVSLFTMVLGHSRFLAGRYFFSQNLHSVLVGHLGAFAAFGGVPEEVLYDRMKTVVLGTDGDGTLVFHPALMALANHYGFRPRVCRPYRAKTKGKIERPIGYIRRDFFLGRTFRNLEDLNGQFERWLCECANTRRHGTTGLIPAEELIKEREHLRVLPGGSFDRLMVEERRMSRDGFISFGGNLYSVPDTVRSRRMELRVYLEHLEIWEKDALVAIHRLSGGKGKRVLDPQHRQRLWQRLKKNPETQGPLFLQEPGWPRLQNPEALVHWGVEVERRDLSLYEELDHG